MFGHQIAHSTTTDMVSMVPVTTETDSFTTIIEQYRWYWWDTYYLAGWLDALDQAQKNK